MEISFLKHVSSCHRYSCRYDELSYLMINVSMLIFRANFKLCRLEYLTFRWHYHTDTNQFVTCQSTIPFSHEIRNHKEKQLRRQEVIGLQKAPLWSENMSKKVECEVRSGYERVRDGKRCRYSWKIGNEFVILILYVDDIFVIGRYKRLKNNRN